MIITNKKIHNKMIHNKQIHNNKSKYIANNKILKHIYYSLSLFFQIENNAKRLHGQDSSYKRNISSGGVTKVRFQRFYLLDKKQVSRQSNPDVREAIKN